MKTVIPRSRMFKEINTLTGSGGTPLTFSIKYRRKSDGTVGFKPLVSKSLKNAAGTGKYRQNVNLTHVLLLHDHTNNRPFELAIDLLIEFNGMIIDHEH